MIIGQIKALSKIQKRAKSYFVSYENGLFFKFFYCLKLEI